MNDPQQDGAVPVAGETRDDRSGHQDTDPGQCWQWCPRCSHRLHNHRCKLVCPRCHYFMSCSDFD